jgi:hypothetical protein
MPTADNEYGFIDNPPNGLGIVRARTMLGNLRLWDIPRDQAALDQVMAEIGGTLPIPGLYMLFDERSDKRVYIGQTENLKIRLLTHIKTPEDKIKHWERAYLINDGRTAFQSDLNDENLRLALEDYLVRLFKINRYAVVTQASRIPSLSGTQKIIYESLREEINILLTRKTKISKVLRLAEDDEHSLEETKRVLLQKGFVIQKWGAHEAVMNHELVLIRPGSQKPQGWQVTFRGSTSLGSLRERKGYLLMPRGRIPLIPLAQIHDFIAPINPEAFEQDTIDVFLRFEEGHVTLLYKGEALDVTGYVLLGE